MTQPTQRKHLAAMRLEDFRAHPRTIAAGYSEEISGAPRPNRLLVRNRKKAAKRRRR
jgi:hypothetical protein